MKFFWNFFLKIWWTESPFSGFWRQYGTDSDDVLTSWWRGSCGNSETLFIQFGGLELVFWYKIDTKFDIWHLTCGQLVCILNISIQLYQSLITRMISNRSSFEAIRIGTSGVRNQDLSIVKRTHWQLCHLARFYHNKSVRKERDTKTKKRGKTQGTKLWSVSFFHDNQHTRNC